MGVRILDRRALAPLIGALMADYRVIGPKARGPGFVFDVIADPVELRLDYTTTILPPSKAALQPPQERLATIHLEGEPSVEPVLEAAPTVLVGVHTCDLQAIRLLDRAFTDDYPDAHYLARRQQTLILSLECLQPCDEYSFCQSMGTLTADGGYDLHLTDIGEAYTVQVGTEAGEALLEKYARTRAAKDTEIQHLEEVVDAKRPRFADRLEFDASELPALLGDAYEHPVWADLGDRCLACGSCTNVCPTCYCFNVVDSIALTQAEATRLRRWDSCQLDAFALVATGENFRQTRAARQRHRLFRKGKWLYERFGELGCVGCGRCIRTCLVHISIVDAFNAIHRSAEGGKSR
jgi:sulfhydrogenase subunit beta (sulfur reductase)